MNEKNDFALQKKLDCLMKKTFQKPIFSGCSLGFFKIEKGETDRKIFNYGRTGLGVEKNLVCDRTFFDLASLTKPLVTSLVFLFLADKGVLKFKDNLAKFFKDINSDKKQIQLCHLLNHTSGLPAHRAYFQELIKIPGNNRQEFVLKKILSENLVSHPGKSVVYSDLGFIILGSILEKVTGEKLDVFWEKNILQPMNIEKQLCFPGKISLAEDNYVETGTCPWSMIKLRGIVNDDNCRALGGVAGHAGLFGTISGLLKYVENLTLEIQEQKNILKLHKETIKTFYKRQSGNSWINGFDTPSLVFSSSGKYFSEVSFGHLGFTGTSFWMDIKKGCGVVLLTNRVLCGEDLCAIRKFRPLIHNLVMNHIKKNQQ
jgi:serine-type D-Ala-D-Ala carboxypeptidase